MCLRIRRTSCCLGSMGSSRRRTGNGGWHWVRWWLSSTARWCRPSVHRCGFVVTGWPTTTWYSWLVLRLSPNFWRTVSVCFTFLSSNCSRRTPTYRMVYRTWWTIFRTFIYNFLLICTTTFFCTVGFTCTLCRTNLWVSLFSSFWGSMTIRFSSGFSIMRSSRRGLCWNRLSRSMRI